MRGMHKFIRGMCRATFTQMPALPQSLPLPLRGQYAGQADGQDLNVVTQTHKHTCMCVLAYSLFDVLGFGAKKCFAQQRPQQKTIGNFSFSFFFLFFRSYARHAKAIDDG